MSVSEQIWNGLIGGDKARKLLGSSLKNDRLIHNYLFEGPMGIGKFPFAISFAKSIVCAEPQSGNFCGECDDCRLIDRGHHPDVIVMSKESDLIVDEARQISNMVMLSPQRSARKVLVLDGIDRMNTSAGNALLKTFEESPGGSIFILTTHRPEKLLPTILSRSLRVPFNLLSGEKLAKEYSRVLGVEIESAQKAAQLSGGRPGWGIRFLIHPEFRELYEYGYKIISESLIKEPLSRIYKKTKLIDEFLEESGRIFAEHDNISGMDGFMISRILSGETVNFKPINLFVENGEIKRRHVDILGFILLGGIFRGMLASGQIDGKPTRYIRLLDAFLEAPRNLERNFNRELVIEKFILCAHGRYKS